MDHRELLELSSTTTGSSVDSDLPPPPPLRRASSSQPTILPSLLSSEEDLHVMGITTSSSGVVPSTSPTVLATPALKAAADDDENDRKHLHEEEKADEGMNCTIPHNGNKPKKNSIVVVATEEGKKDGGDADIETSSKRSPSVAPATSTSTTLSSGRGSIRFRRMPKAPWREKLRGFLFPRWQRGYCEFFGIPVPPKDGRFGNIYEVAMLLAVFLSLITVACFEPLGRDSPAYYETTRYKVLFGITSAFGFLFLLEIVLRWFSLGFIATLDILHTGDNIVVLAVIASLMVEYGGFPNRFYGIIVLRSVRLLKPLGDLTDFPSVAIVVNSITGCLYRITDATLLFVLFLLLMAVTAITQFSRRLRTQCVNDAFDDSTVADAAENFFTAISEMKIHAPNIAQAADMLSTSTLLKNFSSALHGNASSALNVLFNTTGSNKTVGPHYTLANYVCGEWFDAHVLSNLFQMNMNQTAETFPHVAAAAQQLHQAMNISNVSIGFSEIACSPLQRCDDMGGTFLRGYHCPYGYSCREVRNPYGGNVGFDNLALSVLTIFTSVTQQLWYEVGYMARDATDSLAVLFFAFVVIVGGFLIVNLLIVLITIEFDTVRTEEAERIANQAIKDAEAKEGTGGMYGLALQMLRETRAAGAEAMRTTAPRVRSKMKKRISESREAVQKYVSGTKWFAVLSTAAILLNVVMLAYVHEGIPEATHEMIESFSAFFGVFFTVELVLRLIGWVDTSQQRFGIAVDVVVVISVWADLLLPDWNLSWIRVLRTGRVIGILQVVPGVYHWIQFIGRSIKGSPVVIVLLSLFLFVFGIACMQLTGGSFCNLMKPEDVFLTPVLVDNTNEICPLRPRANFDSFWMAIITSFQILTGDDWNIIMYNAMKAQGWWIAVFFSLFFYVSNFVLLSLLMGVMLSVHDDDEKGGKGKKGTVDKDAGYGLGWTDIAAEDDSSAPAIVVDEPTDSLPLPDSSSSHPLVVASAEHQRTLSVDDGGDSLSKSGSGSSFTDSSNPRKKKADALRKQYRMSRRRSIKFENRCQPVDAEFISRWGRSELQEESRDTVKQLQSVGFSLIEEGLAVAAAGDGEEPTSKSSQAARPATTTSAATATSTALRPSVSIVGTADQRHIAIDQAVATDDDMRHEECATLQYFVRKMLKSTPYLIVTTLVTILCLVNLAMYRAIDAPDTTRERNRFFIDTFVVLYFTVEAVLKIWVFGFWGLPGTDTYLRRSSWNVVDFILVLLGLTSLLMFYSNNWHSVYPLLSSIQSIRAITHSRRSKQQLIVLKALGNATWTLRYVTCAGIIIYFSFAVIGVLLLRGKMSSCVPQEQGGDAIGVNVTESLISPRGLDGFRVSAAGWIDGNSSTAVVALPTVNVPWSMLNKTICLSLGGKWEASNPNFDNVWSALFSLFVISTLEQWNEIMYRAMDFSGFDNAPVTNDNAVIAIYFMIFAVLSGFVMANIFTTVLIDAYNREKRTVSSQQSIQLAKDHHGWLLTNRRILRYLPSSQKKKKKKNKSKSAVSTWLSDLSLCACCGDLTNVKERLRRVTRSDRFIMGSLLLVFLNFVFMCTKHYPEPDALTTTLYVASIFFAVAFALEAALKIFAETFRVYIASQWNRLDLFVAVVGVFALVIANFVDARAAAFVESLRILRLARLMKGFSQVGSLVAKFSQSLIQLGHVMMVIFSFSYVTTIFGVRLLGRVRWSRFEFDSINWAVNFSNFGDGLNTLLRLSTGGNWLPLMNLSQSDATGCDANIGDCGPKSPVPQAFYVVFLLFSIYVLRNLLIAVMLDSFSAASDSRGLGKLEASAFIQKWSEVDRQMTLWVPATSVLPFIRSLPSNCLIGMRTLPSGVRVQNELRLLMMLRIRYIHHRRVNFRTIVDVLCRLRYRGSPPETRDFVHNIAEQAEGEANLSLEDAIDGSFDDSFKKAKKKMRGANLLRAIGKGPSAKRKSSFPNDSLASCPGGTTMSPTQSPLDGSFHSLSQSPNESLTGAGSRHSPHDDVLPSHENDSSEVRAMRYFAETYNDTDLHRINAAILLIAAARPKTKTGRARTRTQFQNALATPEMQRTFASATVGVLAKPAQRCRHATTIKSLFGDGLADPVTPAVPPAATADDFELPLLEGSTTSTGGAAAVSTTGTYNPEKEESWFGLDSDDLEHTDLETDELDLINLTI